MLAKEKQYISNLEDLIKNENVLNINKSDTGVFKYLNCRNLYIKNIYYTEKPFKEFINSSTLEEFKTKYYFSSRKSLFNFDKKWWNHNSLLITKDIMVVECLYCINKRKLYNIPEELSDSEMKGLYKKIKDLNINIKNINHTKLREYCLNLKMLE